MDPAEKPRFTLAEDGSGELEGKLKTGRIRFAERIRSGGKALPIFLISGGALAAVAIIFLLTSFFFKKPHIFSPRDEGPAAGGIFQGADKKEEPSGAAEDIHLKRGKESYARGYFNDALAEFAETVESDASDADKAMALTYTGIIHDDRGDFNKAVEAYGRALRYDKKNPAIYRNMALAYRHKKDFDKAGEYAEKAVDLDDKNANNRILLGNVYFEQGQYDKAANAYREVLDIEEGNAGALYNLAVSLHKKGDEMSAIEYYKKAGAADSMGEVSRLAYGRLGALYTGKGELDLAEKYLQMAVSVAPRDAINHYNLGIVYLKQNKSDMALAEFAKAEELGKDDAAVLEGLGEAYFSMKQYERSIDTYGRVLQTDRRNARILSRMAEIYYEKGDLDSAYEYYHKITTLEPASENARVAYLNMGNIMDDAQRYNEAIDSYQKALAISPKDDAALYNLGIAYKHAAKPELAIDAWKKAAELNPENPQPLMALADFYYENNHLDLAMDEYQRLLRRFPRIQEGHFNLAAIYYKKNQIDYAIEEYKRVIEIDDRNDFARKAYINLGVLTSKAGADEKTMEKSASYVQKALMIKPGDADALLSMGLLYSRKEMYDKAIDTFYQAISATSDAKLIAEAHNNIGKCHYKKREYKKALQAFSRAVEEDPTNEEVRMNRKSAMQAYEEELARK